MTDLSDFTEFDGSDGTSGAGETSYKEVDRKRGILTQKDREYLLGETEFEGQDERNIRYRIRERIAQSLLDIRLIANHYNQNDLEQILANEEYHFPGLCTDMIRFSYSVNEVMVQHDNPNNSFENSINLAIESHLNSVELGETSELSVATAEADISVERYDLNLQEAVRALFESDAEIGSYYRLDGHLSGEFYSGVDGMEFDRDDMEDVEIGYLDEEIKVSPLLAEAIRFHQSD